MKMRSKEKIILLVALACTVGLGVWSLYSWLYIGPEKAIERELAKIRAKGEPVTLEELAPPEIPDAENAALIYEQAFAQYYEPPEEEERKLSEISGKDLANWTEEDNAAIREYIEKNEDCLPLIFEAANYDKCRFPLDYSQSHDRMRLSHLSKMRAQARLLARDALLKAKEGKIDEALESTWAGLRLGKAFLDEPILISQILRFAINSITFSALQNVLEENDVEPEMLKRLLEELDIEESRTSFGRGLQGDRCTLIYIFELLINDFAGFVELMHAGSVQTARPTLSRISDPIRWILLRPLFRKGEVFALGFMERIIDLSQFPYYRAKPELDKIDQDLDNAPFYCILSRMLLPVLIRSHLNEAQHEAKIGLTQLALALKIFKAEKGKYPDTLAELVPEILPELPQDPFTGKDFVYKKEGEGFLVYSLGENGTDEGGKWDEKKVYQHDIPWRCKR